MLKKENRFHGHRDVRRVYRKGYTVRSQGVTLKYTKNNNTPTRLTVVVSKKVSKSAPTRNRIRRRFYEEVRKNLHQIKPGYDLVLTIYDENFALEPAEKITKTVNRLLVDAGLYSPT